MKVCQYCVAKVKDESAEKKMKIMANGSVKFNKEADSGCEANWASMSRIIKFSNCQ